MLRSLLVPDAPMPMAVSCISRPPPDNGADGEQDQRKYYVQAAHNALSPCMGKRCSNTSIISELSRARSSPVSAIPCRKKGGELDTRTCSPLDKPKAVWVLLE